MTLAPRLAEFGVDRPLSARSLILSSLMGLYPSQVPVRTLVTLTGLFGIEEGTTRVALSRMVIAAELTKEGATYGLSGPILDRLSSQDLGRSGIVGKWDGKWWGVVITADCRQRSERDEFRTMMANLRFVELRDGVWGRPTNLVAPESHGHFTVWRAELVTEDPIALACRLWNLPGWVDNARSLCDAMGAKPDSVSVDDAAELRDRFMLSAAINRHLRADPLLPAALLPEDWPGEALRAEFECFYTDFTTTIRTYLGVPA
ncbi:MAG: PaaX domain-containing protein, C- domain protein [Acidobacteria bacterium]|nr:PaaX domain-containing protein, C- domain protein [Acidobacteriota bacterium]